MSYEGYEQHICANGHLFYNYDIYYFERPTIVCHCGADSVWQNSVDDTNCDANGYIPEELFRHYAPGVFAIPTQKESLAMQTYRENDDLFFIETNERVIFPEYDSDCGMFGEFCSGVGTEIIYHPQVNPCKE